MNTKQILMSQAGTPFEELPKEYQERLEADPQKLQEFQEQARVATLMGLKNYEQADPAMEGRVLHRVGIRIRNGEHLRRESRFEALPDWARMVAVVLVMLGLSMLTHREMMESTPPESASTESTNDRQVLANAKDVVPLPDLSTPVTPLSSESFNPVFVTYDSQETPNIMTPEFSSQLESSILELGLDLTNRTQNVNTIPVVFRP